MVMHMPSLTRILPLTRRHANALAAACPGSIEGYLSLALHPFELRWLQNAPEEDVPHLERRSHRIVFHARKAWDGVGGLFAAAFVHPEFERIYLKHRPFEDAPCTITVSESGVVIAGRPLGHQRPDQFQPWQVELPFVDEEVKTIGERKLPIVIDPDRPQDPDFIRSSLQELDTVFDQQPRDIYWNDPASWCKARFMGDSGTTAFTELFPGIWFASQDSSAGDVLIVCSAERFVLNSCVQESAVFFRSETMFAISKTGFSRPARCALWELAWGDTEAQSEAEDIRLMLRTLVRDRHAHHTPEDALARPITPRPFFCQRYY